MSRWTIASEHRKNHQNWKGIATFNLSKPKTCGPAQIDRYLWRVLIIWRSVDRHVRIVPDNVEWTLRLDFNRQTQSRPLVANNTTYTHRTVLLWAKRSCFWEFQKLEHASNKCDRSRTTRVRLTNCLRTEERWNFEVLCWIQKSQCRNYSWFVSLTKNEQIHSLSERCLSNFKSWHE